MQQNMLGTLIIRPVRAQILHSTSHLSEMSPYIRIKYGGKEYRTKVAQSAGKNPVFFDNFEFQQIGETTIHVEVWDKNSFTADEYIGETVISFPGVYQFFRFDSPSIFYKKGKEMGTVYFEFEFKPIANLIVQPVYGSPQPNYYNPSMNANQQPYGVPPTGFGNQPGFGMPPSGYGAHGDGPLQGQNLYQIPQQNYYQPGNQGNAYGAQF